MKKFFAKVGKVAEFAVPVWLQAFPASLHSQTQSAPVAKKPKILIQ
jgi:hypothetical protein